MLQAAQSDMAQAISTEYMQLVENRIKDIFKVKQQYLSHSAEFLSSIAYHLCIDGESKRARPMLVRFFAETLNVSLESVVDFAATAELLHSASLLHDDVVDNASMRRGVPTANSRYGNAIAVLGGDYLLSLSFSLLHEHPRSISNEAIEVVSQMTRAAIAEIEVRSNLPSDEVIWRQIAVGKTGRLFSWCGQAVALANENIEAAERFLRCGSHIGVAFQLIDDIRDFAAGQKLKDRFADIRNKEPSFPIISAARLNPSLKKEISNLWANEIVTFEAAEELGQRIISSGALEHSYSYIAHEIDTAQRSLGPLASSIGGANICGWLTTLHKNALANF